MSAAFVATDNRTSWGRVIRARHYIARPRFTDQFAHLLREAAASGRSALGVGLGRSYGDSNLNPDNSIISVTGCDRLIAFDPLTGVLAVEAGISLAEILRFAVPRGWFLPTTPGTRFVTVGGAIANDVHGKNHYSVGAFGCAVRRIGLVRSDRGAIEVSAIDEPELFAATIGGLGLTGMIAWAELQLTRVPSSCIDQEITPFANLDAYFSLADNAHTRLEHHAAWIDCTGRGADIGRGIFIGGNWSQAGGRRVHRDKIRLALPFDGHALLFAPFCLRALNLAYRTLLGVRAGASRVHYAPHLFPLDAIGAWNRLYGGDGFYQYQCVVPNVGARGSVAELLNAIADSCDGSVLAVLKSFGPKRSPGLLSFPMPGVTLAMDFVNRGEKTIRLFARLDDIVRAAGGRLYAAKDGRIPALMFQHGYPEWRRFADSIDPAMSSSFWRRVSQ